MSNAVTETKPRKKRRWWLRILVTLIVLGVLGTIAVGGTVLYGFYYYGRDLPDYRMLANYKPPEATRIYAGNGELMAQYATQDRVFVPIKAIPKLVRDAFISAEDQNFYHNIGIDPVGIVRAALYNLRNIGEGRRLQGASTITQQVAKNFLLTDKVSYVRKIKEAILAIRIDHALSKNRILELYLNQIYLGRGTYGVAAAALKYFGKSLDDLTIAQAAFLGALPKGPNNYDPATHHAAALVRRNWVISRMAKLGYITAHEAAQAQAQPLVAVQNSRPNEVSAGYATEAIRRWIVKKYGTDALYQGGLYVRSTLDPRLQKIARESLQEGLSLYDRRYGWRGPIGHIALDASWRAALAHVQVPTNIAPWRSAVVLGMNDQAAVIGFADGSRGAILLKDMSWARKELKGGGLGPRVTKPSDVLAAGDVIVVTPAKDTGSASGQAPLYALRQIPQVSGGIVALDPHTGRILAMQGGFSYDKSEFNRATQAKRQPGSAFKPFVYMAALDHGFTPATLIEDAPFVYDPGNGQPIWKPTNYEHHFYGPTPLRVGIEKSINLMTIRLANVVGPKIVDHYAVKFGVIDKDVHFYLPMALGAADTTLLRLTAAYGMIVNGGKRIHPSLIERIQDRNGKTIWRRDKRDCTGCQQAAWHQGEPVPQLPDTRQQIEDPRTAYQMVSILEGVVQRGTGASIRSLDRPLAGKTGTTNKDRDAWFVGFSPDLAVGVYVGFDKPRTLGPHETGASVAVPIWKQFMGEALAGTPKIPFRIPPGIRLVRIDADRGLLPGPLTTRVITEAFRAGTEPTKEATSANISNENVIDGSDVSISGVY